MPERIGTELAPFLRRLRALGILIAALLVVGTIGFSLIEHVSAAFAFEWTLDTAVTTGSIANPERPAGQVLKVLIELLGVGTLFYALVTITEFFVAGHLGELLEHRRTQRMIDALTDHYIICGFGRVGRQVARDLRAAHARYVVIDDNPENRDLARGVGIRFLEGEAAEDDMLLQAGIDRARAVIACVDSDAENIFITLSAKELRPDVMVIARASVEDSEKKLKRAGADRVISPYKASGSEMARLALHPQVGGAVDVSAEYRLEEITVTAACAGEGQTVGDIRGGAVIVALRHADGALEPQPPAETALCAGDRIVAMGTPATLARLESLFQPAQVGAAG
jgi:voltage-gated potassium channel